VKGVGSHAAHMLIRAGVGRLKIIDFDQVILSSFNSIMLYSTCTSDVGSFIDLYDLSLAFAAVCLLPQAARVYRMELCAFATRLPFF
jgi:molybdopterin/thiamine biosynthesis adenylyltransferase